MSVSKPSWFSDSRVMVSTAPTCGLTKGGRPLSKVDPITGQRIQQLDAETGEYVDAIDDQLLTDAAALATGKTTETLSFVPSGQVDLRCAVPIYFDRRYENRYREEIAGPEFVGFTSSSLGDLVEANVVQIRGGHGSPSQDQRVGDVPYIKVSDLRAGLVNINPTNRIPLSLAKRFWGVESSGLRAFDLLCPERTSKNIGDFCVLMPGQENVVLTREIIVIRPGARAEFDSFYLLWALTLKIVRDQWRRIVFMQTNREDVGKRYLEIEIPVPRDRSIADEVSASFRSYFLTLANARANLIEYLNEDHRHHFFVSGAD